MVRRSTVAHAEPFRRRMCWARLVSGEQYCGGIKMGSAGGEGVGVPQRQKKKKRRLVSVAAPVGLAAGGRQASVAEWSDG